MPEPKRLSRVHYSFNECNLYDAGAAAQRELLSGYVKLPGKGAILLWMAETYQDSPWIFPGNFATLLHQWLQEER